MGKTAEASIGHNNPPEDPFESCKQEISDLYLEAKNWLDGEGVNSDEEDAAVAKLLDMLRKALKKAEEARKEENKPFDEGKAKVQAKYAELTADTKSKKGLAILAMDACKAALAPYRAKKEEARLAEERKRREEAAELERLAREKMQNSRDNLEEREQAETLLAESKQATKEANKSARNKTKGLVTHYRAEMSDPTEAAKYYWKHRKADMEIFLLELAQADVRAGKRLIPGFNIIEEKKAR